MRVVYNDGSWFVGRRGWKEMGYLYNHESRGTHHFTLLGGSVEFDSQRGIEIAVPLVNVKYFILNYRW